LLVHYGHSCLIPIDKTHGITVLYVFVDIKFDMLHRLETIKLNFPNNVHIGMVSTIQFVNSLHAIAKELKDIGYKVTIPKSQPLSPGEILGCTSPSKLDCDILMYLGGGNLESTMMANPHLSAYMYDPYLKKFTMEGYDHSTMKKNRNNAIVKASSAKRFGLIIGSLGRQGSSKVADFLLKELKKREVVTLLLSEIFPYKLAAMSSVDAWIQIACPRLSIDWGLAFQAPLLTPYEASVAFGKTKWCCDSAYPMDFYANNSLGSWTPNYKPPKSDKR
jgi:2-(3-amino-3-carboxypropyl)histidine synthase